MTLKLSEADELFRKVIFGVFRKYTCPECGETIIVDPNDVEQVLFEPYEKEEEFLSFDIEKYDNGKIDYSKEKRMRTYSSDIHKDTFKFTCPVCGKVVEIPADEYIGQKRYALDGKQHHMFVLSEAEYEKAEAFRKKHDHRDEFTKTKGSPFFSTLGQQFSYTFIPGGLGDSIIIECNHCHEKEEISDEW